MIRIFLKTKLIIFSLFTLVYFSARATTFPISVTLSGAQEVPANQSAGTGTLTGTYDDATNVLKYTVTFSGLSANTIAAHFHAPAPPGIIAPVLYPAANFPTGVTSGNYSDSITLTSGQEDTLKLGLFYFNIHTTTFTGGEIRAQIFLQGAGLVVPDIHCPGDTTLNNETGLCSASVAFVATDTTGKPTSTLYYRIGNTAIESPYVFPVGTTQVVATALNSAGFDTCAFTVTVKDVENPVITCPANITAPNDPGQCGAIVSFTATATDNCPGVHVTFDHDSGSFFPVGTTTVVATATDSSGNTATCSFTVTVNDVEPPVIHDLNTTPRILWPPNNKMRDVTVDYTSTDNCPGPITCEITVTSDNLPANHGHGHGFGVGNGNGNPHSNSSDWTIVDDHHVQLRAQRDGGSGGRVYTLGIACTDQYGNTGRDTATVLVPHDLRSAEIRALILKYGLGRLNSQISGTDLPSVANSSLIFMNEEDANGGTIIRVYPNPSTNYFTVNIETGNSQDNISVRLIDVAGRIVESKANLVGSQTLRIGNNLRPGLYFAEIRQGNSTKTIKLLKQE